MRVFLDANVIFSAAHNPDGNCRALFKLAVADRVEVVASRYAVEEAVRNVALKFPDCAGDLEALLPALTLAAEPSVAAVAVAASAGLPEKDAPILAAAITARADLLVTGDRRHFGALYGQTIEGVQIVTPAEALTLLLNAMGGR